MESELVAGLDEVGVGPWAGPMLVVVAAFSDEDSPHEDVDDSKKVSKKKRLDLAPQIVEAADYLGCGWVSAGEIDNWGMGMAWQLAASRALEDAPKFKELLIDGVRPVHGYTGAQATHTKGESKFWQIAAASIVAKVLRDHEMEYLAESYPAYGFEKHAGYGTQAHQKQLLLAGPCPEHRRLFLRKFIMKHRPRWAE